MIREELMFFFGVGRKMVNVVLGDVFGILVIVVDIYVECVLKWLRICKLDVLVMEVEEILMWKVL